MNVLPQRQRSDPNPVFLRLDVSAKARGANLRIL